MTDRAAPPSPSTSLSPELVALLEDPGFTAGKKTFALVLAALGDETFEKKAFRAIERAGSAALPALRTALYGEQVLSGPARASAIRLVGRLARAATDLSAATETPTSPATDLLEQLLDETDPRTFREVLVQLAKGAETPTLTPRLLAAAQRWFAPAQGTNAVRPADRDAIHREILWALATVGGTEGRAFAAENGLAGKGAVVARREEARASGDVRLGDDVVAGVTTWRLRCRAGFEQLLHEEVIERLGSALEEVRVERGVVSFRGAISLAALGAVRTASEIEAIFDLALSADETSKFSPKALARAFATQVAPWLTPLFAREALGSGASPGRDSEALATAPAMPRFRVSMARRGGRGRAEIFALAEAFASHGLVSDGRNAPVSVEFERITRFGAAPSGGDRSTNAEGVRVAITLAALGEGRFAYRVAEVPAASHPSVAAALVRASRPRAEDVVWDPFCGSALELCERANAGPYAALYGTDRERRAIDAALANSAGIERITLTVDDACTARPAQNFGATVTDRAQVNAIVTNPPLGRRVQDSEGITRLLVRFLGHAATVLAPGGRLVWLSPAPRATREAAAAVGLVLREQRAVDLGGIAVELQIFEAVV